MKRIFSIFFLFIMSANVVVSLVEQLHDVEWYEISEGCTDDTDDQEKSEKEKKADTFFCHTDIATAAFHLPRRKDLLGLKSYYFISEYHGLLPELPPEA